MKARRNGVECRLGGRDWFDLERRSGLKIGPPVDAGFSEVWIEAGDLLGRVILRDDIRPQAATVIDELRDEGLRTVVLTGDRKAAAEHLRDELTLDDVRAELKPEGKVAAIQELSGQGKQVAMVGDGVNDAPSLAAAHIGVAMGARGSDAALEQADVVLMHDRLENFLAAFRLSQRARARHPAESVHFPRHGGGAGHVRDAWENSADDWRGWARRQHRDRGDEQLAALVRQGAKELSICQRANRGDRA